MSLNAKSFDFSLDLVTLDALLDLIDSDSQLLIKVELHKVTLQYLDSLTGFEHTVTIESSPI